ncbi:MAG: hypothetical protein ACFCBU_06390 [Cyanophyceae cyanobacterium]
MSWTANRKKDFRAALLEAYRDRGRLRVFVADALDKNLDEVTRGCHQLNP